MVVVGRQRRQRIALVRGVRGQIIGLVRRLMDWIIGLGRRRREERVDLLVLHRHNSGRLIIDLVLHRVVHRRKTDLERLQMGRAIGLELRPRQIGLRRGIMGMLVGLDRIGLAIRGLKEGRDMGRVDMGI
jgi:hypothetical protein